ncbi:MAG: ABC transporter permease [Deltaproteobacteria bacterium]|nr:ABC transporter permease [Deltaproteobacteria bacterium]MBW2154343.1 ABC transporter permease [Deltaproteobacteria bacterium]
MNRLSLLVKKHRWLKSLYRNKGVWIGGVIVLFMVFIAIFAPVLTPLDPMRLNPMNRLKPPMGEHLFGTDGMGRDVFSMVIYGARISLGVGILVMMFTCLVGIVMGLISGYYKVLDNIIMRINDGMMAVPSIILAIALMAVLGPRVSNIVVALSVVYTPRMARIIRGSVLSAKELTYVEAARALGTRDLVIAFRHILPNCVAPMIVQGTFIFAYSVLAEASLSFLGVGAPPYIPSWGNVVSEGRLYMLQAPWISLFPGLAILIFVMGLNLLGDGLRDSLDPKMQGVQR